MSDTIQTLTDFLTAAEKSRKYPPNTVYGIKAALRLFGRELKDQEKESVDVFKEHFEQINQIVFNKNKTKIAAASLGTYRRRMLGLLNDYEKYGVDPTKLTTWNRPLRQRRSIKTDKEPTKPVAESTQPEQIPTNLAEIDRHELTLRPGVKAIILVPSDLRPEEIKRIQNLVDYLAKDKGLK